VLPGVERVEGTSELLTGPRMQGLIDTLANKKQSRVALFDLPPILVGDDVVALSEMLDAVILIVEEDVTTSTELEKALELLKETTVLGCVLNKAKDNEVKSYGEYY
jgi:Mrp family chromosome partitioning ATPase